MEKPYDFNSKPNNENVLDKGGSAPQKRKHRLDMKNYDLIIDWFECTFLGQTEINQITNKRVVTVPLLIQDIFKKFGLDPYGPDFVNLPTGLNGYNYTFCYKEKIKFMVKLDSLIDYQKGIYGVMLSYNKNMGVHMMLSGYACREFEKEFNWFWLFNYCIETDANISRLDIAWDVFSNRYISLGRIIDSVRSSSVTCRSKTALICDEIYIESGEVTGQSIKFGSSASNMMLMCYDKLKERAKASYTVNGVDYWVRLELRLRKEVAYNFLREVQKGPKDFTIKANEALFGFVKFRIKEDNPQKTRWPVADWWQKFMMISTNLCLSNKAIQTTIQQKMRWVDLSVAKTVAQCLLAVDPSDLYGFQLQQMLIDGVEKIQRSDLKQINTYRLEQGGSVITEEELRIIKDRLVCIHW